MDKGIEIFECGETRESGKRLVALLMNREQLLYDIENICYTEGHVMTESPDDVRHTVQDVGQSGNVDRVTRVLDLAHADIVERLYPFTQRDIEEDVLDDRLREKTVYGIFLSVPEDFSQTTLNLLGKLIHELMVCEAVADWLGIADAQKGEAWRMKADGLIGRINQVKNFRRGRRIRIRPHWLG